MDASSSENHHFNTKIALHRVPSEKKDEIIALDGSENNPGVSKQYKKRRRSQSSGTELSFQQDNEDEDQSDEDEEDEEEGEDASANAVVKLISKLQIKVGEGWRKIAVHVRRIFALCLLAGYYGYFGYAMYYEKLAGEASVRLCWVTCLVSFCLVIHFVLKWKGDALKQMMTPQLRYLSQHNATISWLIVTVTVVAIVIFTFVDVLSISKKPYNLVSGAGLVVYLLVLFIFSHNPAKIKWRPVVWGLTIQFLFALLILRWDPGYEAARWLGDRFNEFMRNAQAGAAFVFGDSYTDHFFAFSVLPSLIFVSSVIYVLYFLGAMQVVIFKIAWIMQVAMATTAGESVNAAANIFLGMTGSPILIRPFLNSMTASELHAVMTGGFATVAGSLMAGYVSLGVSATHVIAASFMSAPAALAIAKLFYPETKKSKTKANEIARLSQANASHNLIGAAADGASSAISLVANIAVNLVAFIALLEFCNNTLTWFGHRVGIGSLTLQFIFSYLMWPFSVLMGIDIADCRKAASLIGIKTFLNEFIAYEFLGKIIRNKELWRIHAVENNMTWAWFGDDVILTHPNGTETFLENGIMTERSITISTYALCGFANIGSIGIELGVLGAMAPKKKTTIAKVVVRAMIAGTIADFLTACIAGLYFQGEDV